MGKAIAMRLIAAGMPLIGFDVAASRSALLGARGGTVALSMRELAARCPTVIVAVYDGSQVEVLLDEIAHEPAATRPVVICTTTCGVDEIVRLGRRAAGAGIALIEAPISGTSAEVRDGTAMALVGGEAGVIEQAGPLFDIVCPRRIRLGAIGEASRAKLAINLVLQNNRAALAEGIVFAERLGLDGRVFLAAARQSAAYSRAMDSKGDKMLLRDFAPQSRIAQTLKDAELIIEEAGRRDLHLPVTSAQAELLRAAIALTGPDADSAAVIEAIGQQPAAAAASR